VVHAFFISVLPPDCHYPNHRSPEYQLSSSNLSELTVGSHHDQEYDWRRIKHLGAFLDVFLVMRGAGMRGISRMGAARQQAGPVLPAYLDTELSSMLAFRPLHQPKVTNVYCWLPLIESSDFPAGRVISVRLSQKPNSAASLTLTS
jgi:hypothetical protein